MGDDSPAVEDLLATANELLVRVDKKLDKVLSKLDRNERLLTEMSESA